LAEVASGSLSTRPRFTDTAAVCVVMASEGYPESPRTGDAIAGLDAAARVEGVTVFHAGTASAGPTAGEGAVVTAGGRVLGVTALGPTIAEARTRAYRGVGAISWPGAHARTDIAQEAASSDAGHAPSSDAGRTAAADLVAAATEPASP
jgi:phosphoribosylamine--glycine ligase